MGGGSRTEAATVPAYIEEAARANLAKAGELAQTGYTPYYGPDVAAFTPMQEAAFQGTNLAASAFGLPSFAMGMPAPTTYAGGVRGYSSAPMYEQSLNALRTIMPAQFERLTRPFANPVTGYAPITPFGAGTPQPIESTAAFVSGTQPLPPMPTGGMGAPVGPPPVFAAPPVAPPSLLSPPTMTGTPTPPAQQPPSAPRAPSLPSVYTDSRGRTFEIPWNNLSRKESSSGNVYMVNSQGQRIFAGTELDAAEGFDRWVNSQRGTPAMTTGGEGGRHILDVASRPPLQGPVNVIPARTFGEDLRNSLLGELYNPPGTLASRTMERAATGLMGRGR